MNEASSPPIGRRRAPRWMWIVLMVSLALNLAVVGMALAAAYHWRMAHGGPGAGFSQFVDTLPDQRQSELRTLVDQRAAIWPLRKRAWRVRREARKVFAAEPFDLKRLQEVNAEVGAAQNRLNGARGDWFVKMATELTAVERQQYLKWRKKHHRHRRWRRRDRSRE